MAEEISQPVDCLTTCEPQVNENCLCLVVHVYCTFVRELELEMEMPQDITAKLHHIL